MWPIIAVAGVAIAAGALFLVWKQMQDKPPIIIAGSGGPENAGGTVPPPPPATASDAAVATVAIDATVVTPPGTGGGSDKHPAVDPHPVAPEVVINRVIERSTPAMKQCVKEHLDRAVPICRSSSRSRSRS